MEATNNTIPKLPIFDYQPNTAQAIWHYVPESEEELELRRGDIVTDVTYDKAIGWLKGTLGDKSGIFPSWFVNFKDDESYRKEENSDQNGATKEPQPPVDQPKGATPPIPPPSKGPPPPPPPPPPSDDFPPPPPPLTPSAEDPEKDNKPAGQKPPLLPKPVFMADLFAKIYSRNPPVTDSDPGPSRNPNAGVGVTPSDSESVGGQTSGSEDDETSESSDGGQNTFKSQLRKAKKTRLRKIKILRKQNSLQRTLHTRDLAVHGHGDDENTEGEIHDSEWDDEPITNI